MPEYIEAVDAERLRQQGIASGEVRWDPRNGTWEVRWRQGVGSLTRTKTYPVTEVFGGAWAELQEKIAERVLIPGWERFHILLFIIRLISTLFG